MRMSPDEYLAAATDDAPYHPGERRGPGGKAHVITDCAPSYSLPTWAPAFAGVVSGGETRT